MAWEWTTEEMWGGFLLGSLCLVLLIWIIVGLCKRWNKEGRVSEHPLSSLSHHRTGEDPSSHHTRPEEMV